MIIRKMDECPPFAAGDGSLLREFFHPEKDSLDLRYSLAHAEVDAGKSTSPHRLKSSEVYCILNGTGIMHIDSEAENVASGQAVYIPPGSVQFIENPGPTKLEFLCIVDPAWRQDDETIL